MTPPPTYDDDFDDDFDDDDDTPYRSPRGRDSGSDVYDAFESRGRKRRRSKRKPQSNWIGWVIGGTVILGGIFFCGCCGGLVMIGSNAIEEEVSTMLDGHPQIVENIGLIVSFKTNFTKSFGTENEEEYFYDVVGTEGTCEMRLIQHSDADGFEVVDSATMIMPDGSRIELDLSDW